MKAIGYYHAGPIERADALVETELPDPVPAGRDLLVRVEAVSVNPVDVKLRAHQAPADGQLRVLGFDAVGVVAATGPEATLFKPGERVFYAGSIRRPGSNAELQLVDERIVGPAPTGLSAAEAAALPLTALTAWEMLFDRLEVRRPVRGGGNAILIIGGAGGVGSIAIQLAKKLAGLSVIATASRPETRDWVTSLGADAVVDHSKPLAAEVKKLGVAPGFVFSTTETEAHFDEIVELIAPQGRFGVISGIGKADANKLSGKSVALCFELMFTRPTFETPDMIEQHNILAEVSRLVGIGTLRTTLGENLGRISAENLKRAHALVESGRARGKIVLEGW
ncbi:MAG TPA: zinc-binding alcohol dehydrogenase family protein [Devosiaceae bacterium]|nr:zinc-binding alcohol dehydrogenase family protein [Devosiaceae bacterium]